ncbi:MAG: hypothetical protein V1799_13120 [bacterium]
MNQSQLYTSLLHFNWRWIIVIYCLLILFPLTLTCFSFGFPYDKLEYRLYTVWLTFSVCTVCLYTGYHSSYGAILEAGVAGLLFTATLLLSFKTPWESDASYLSLRVRVSMFLLIYFSGILGALIGRLWKMKMEKRALQAAGKFSS